MFGRNGYRKLDCKTCYNADRRYRYHTDPEVRRKQIACSDRWNRTHREERNVIMARHQRKRYQEDEVFRENDKARKRRKRAECKPSTAKT